MKPYRSPVLSLKSNTSMTIYVATGSWIRQKKLSFVFERARGCQGMVLQLVFDPLAYLQYSALPDHRPGPAAFYQSPGAKHLVPGLVAEDHAEHHVHGGAAGSDQSGVVGVEHDLSARALLPLPETVVVLVEPLPRRNVVLAVKTREVGHGDAASNSGTHCGCEWSGLRC